MLKKLKSIGAHINPRKSNTWRSIVVSFAEYILSVKNVFYCKFPCHYLDGRKLRVRQE
ncbi:GSCOCG00005248001-RA-CDS [Cotesia congregata]|nr:GSCOCG00005248001-RA-CDS [Cotesia congregata]